MTEKSTFSAEWLNAIKLAYNEGRKDVMAVILAQKDFPEGSEKRLWTRRLAILEQAAEPQEATAKFPKKVAEAALESANDAKAGVYSGEPVGSFPPSFHERKKFKHI